MSETPKFTQSQSHGLFWDSEIREKVFNLPICINDTHKFDIPSDKNRFNPNENISIKTSGNTNIDCGDILRFYDRDINEITMILIRYEQILNQKKIKEIIEINYCEEMRRILFGSITRDILENYVLFITQIPHGSVSNDVKNVYKKQKNEIQAKYNMRINISPKVDSKKQRRVQCSIPNFEKILEDFPQCIISRTNENNIRGIQITHILESPKRIRNKKTPSEEFPN